MPEQDRKQETDPRKIAIWRITGIRDTIVNDLREHFSDAEIALMCECTNNALRRLREQKPKTIIIAKPWSNQK